MDFCPSPSKRASLLGGSWLAPLQNIPGTTSNRRSPHLEDYLYSPSPKNPIASITSKAVFHLARVPGAVVAGTTTMPPHLHPRSRMTSSIFATTLLASFLVVGLPHMLPCPSPRIAYTEGELGPDGKRWRRRKCVAEVATDGLVKEGHPCQQEPAADEELEMVDGKREKRDCPIPKPGGVVGEMLGFKRTGSNTEENGVVRPP